MNGLSTGTRWSIYALLIVVSAGMMAARVARVRSPDPKSPTPFLSANDRSRWATIRSLGDDGTYAIDHIIFNERGNRVRGWHTIDLVKHRGRDGREHYYSSKPTLLTTMLAGEYWLIKAVTGATLEHKTHYVARVMIFLTNVLPLVLGLIVLAALIDRLSDSDGARLFAVAAACVGTFLTTFSVTLNNHLIAGVSLIVALAAIVPMWRDQRFDWWRMFLAGLAMGFLAANELPALSICVLAGLGLAWKAPLKTLLAYVPAVLLVAAAAFGTNIVAHGDWRTPYAHRGDGPAIAAVPGSTEVQLDAGILPADFVTPLAAQGISLSERAIIEQRSPGYRWVLWDEVSQQRFAIVKNPSAEPAKTIEIRRWNNWYDYEGSYWKPENVKGVDRGEPSPLVYAFNVLIGHHGLFSLTPLWLLSVIGCGIWLATNFLASSSPASGRRQPPGNVAPPNRLAELQFVLAATTTIITLVVLAFYLTRPQIDRNYGGGTCCLRWMIWLTPLWLLTLLPTAERLWQSRWGRGLLLALLGVSVFSANYAADNPWSHPWLFDYWTWLGWLNYQ